MKNKRLIMLYLILISGSPKVVFRYEDFNLTGYPSSIAKDNSGNLWIGSFGGGQVRIIKKL